MKLTVGEEAAGKRVDLFVGEQLKLSRAKLKALFEAEKVRVQGRKAKKGLTVQAGQVVEVDAEVSEGPEAPILGDARARRSARGAASRRAADLREQAGAAGGASFEGGRAGHGGERAGGPLSRVRFGRG
ncbi:MAG: hypothetical protein QM723_33725 [Myxococcaceae bacterium]